MTIADTMHDTAETIKESLDHYEVRSFDPLGHKAVILLAEDLRLLMKYFDSDFPGATTEHRKEITEQIKRRFGIVEVEDYLKKFEDKKVKELTNIGRRVTRHNGSEVTTKNYVKTI